MVTRRSQPLIAVLWAALAAPAQTPPRFNRDVLPILAENCFACHGPDQEARQGDLRLDRREDAMAALAPGQPAESEVLRRITAADPKERMPPRRAHKHLTAAQKDTLQRWIAAGAEYEPHWSLVPLPREVPVPDLGGPWVQSPVDAFVLAKLHAHGLQPMPAAEKATWLRRVTFGLTGLPPTLAELDQYEHDHSPAAAERVVDRLLQSPAHAEHFATSWLDLARYADTFGYQADRDMHVWPWRDWLLDAIARNLPYDQFVTWQLAGDLLPDATREQRQATTFLRLHRQTNEGGSVPEEFQCEYVADRVRTVGTAFLGLTMECARCHDHKYDPIGQRDYYALGAFLANIDESGVYSHFTETAPTPAMLLYAGDQQAEHDRLLAQIAQAQARLATLKPTGVAPLEPALPAPVAQFAFEDGSAASGWQQVSGPVGQAIEFAGDEGYVCKDAGAFNRTDRFTFALWVRPAVTQPRMMVLHRSRAAEDSGFRGYALTLDQGRPQFALVHFWPGNALAVRAVAALPEHQWTHLTVTYDGSSRAAGVEIYRDGVRVPTEVLADSLTRGITHQAAWGDSDVGAIHLTLGARFRDVGFKAGAIDQLAIFGRDLTAVEVALLTDSRAALTAEDRRAHLARQDPGWQQQQALLQQLRQAEDTLVAQVPQVMVMAERAVPRATFLLRRGAYDAPTERVEPGTPASLPPFPPDQPRNRLGLARWLTDPDHPLTARVAVNRVWALLFGSGLVATPEDFGTQGQPPSHPELLDWLARDFVDHGYDLRRLCRQLALSSVYRQASTPLDPAQFAADPDNRLLGRGPRQRLTAEQLRDQVLAASGLLVRKVGGPSVKPYQPAGFWEEAGTGKSYDQAHGEGLYRRSLYTFWRRTAPPPAMTLFDAPSREGCVARRESTRTPLQLLAVWNDPQRLEAARVLAGRLLRDHPSDRDRVRAAFRSLTSREPDEAETRILLDLRSQQQARLLAEPWRAEALLSVGEAPRQDGLDPSEQAALSLVVQLLWSHDECLTCR